MKHFIDNKRAYKFLISLTSGFIIYKFFMVNSGQNTFRVLFRDGSETMQTLGLSFFIGLMIYIVFFLKEKDDNDTLNHL
jgi:hypothetical protein